jgi:hypothetical protein
MAASSTVSATVSPTRWPDRLLVLIGFGCFAVALFHAAAIVWPGVSEPSPPWRHALFIGINAFFGAAFVRRVRWLPWALAPLTVQQIWSHGEGFLQARAAQPPRWDLQSLSMLVTLPVLWVVVVAARREGSG